MRRGGIALVALAALTAPALAREVPMTLRNAHVVPLTFAEMKGWPQDNHLSAFNSFMKSCAAILHGTKAMRAKRPMFGGLFIACEQAKKIDAPTEASARAFFETSFRPMRVAKAGDVSGFYTGYYETEVEGSLTKTAEYSVPFYGIPAKSGGKSTVFGQFDRARIEKGALAGKGLEICWVKHPVDVFFAQIQGSTRVKLDDGSVMRLNYIASNGQKYYPVGRDLIERGIIAKQDMSMDRIRQWMLANPDEGKELREKNRSYVFFEKTKLAPHTQIVGAQGVPLTPLRSIAVDRSLHVYGTPVWIDAHFPIESEEPATPFRRLVIAQDTGSAIVGPARADIFFGAGNSVELVAGRMKDHGEFVMLVPNSVALKGDSGPPDIPLPQQRPAEIVTRTAEAAGAPQCGMSSRDGKRRVLSYDERVLWTTVTKSIAPMREALPDVDAPAAPEPDAAKPKRATRVHVPVPTHPPAKPSPPPLQPLDRRTRQRVARGREQIDARMDLHGLTQSEAHAALARFLNAASTRGARLVLIITGKGGRGAGERGVLRRQVPQWLALPELRDLVIGFEDAHIAHGGEGALYVRLRRRRGGGEAD